MRLRHYCFKDRCAYRRWRLRQRHTHPRRWEDKTVALVVLTYRGKFCSSYGRLEATPTCAGKVNISKHAALWTSRIVVCCGVTQIVVCCGMTQIAVCCAVTQIVVCCGMTQIVVCCGVTQIVVWCGVTQIVVCCGMTQIQDFTCIQTFNDGFSS
jgi:hypothetical protein